MPAMALIARRLPAMPSPIVVALTPPLLSGAWTAWGGATGRGYDTAGMAPGV
jgi:hypothetical protein